MSTLPRRIVLFVAISGVAIATLHAGASVFQATAVTVLSGVVLMAVGWFFGTPGMRRLVYRGIPRRVRDVLHIEEPPAVIFPARDTSIGGEILRTILGDVEGGGGTGVCILLRLRNTGAPRAVGDWTVEIQPHGDGSTHRLQLFHIPSVGLSFAGGDNVEITQDDSIAEKASSPIPTGALVTGALFGVTGIPRDVIQRPGTIMRVRWVDVSGAEGVAEQIFDSRTGGGWLHFPGMQTRPMPPRGDK